MNRISELRNKLGISMKEAAARLDVPFNQRAQDSSSCRRTRKATIHRIIFAFVVAFFCVFLSADYFLTTLRRSNFSNFFRQSLLTM